MSLAVSQDWIDEHAGEVVALAASPEQRAATQARKDSVRIRNAAANSAKTSGSWTGMALEQAVQYTQRVLRNNREDASRAMRRPDVVAAFKHASGLAHQRVRPTVDKAWNTGVLLGNSAARKQAAATRSPKPKMVQPDTAVLRRLRLDVDKILASVPQMIAEEVERSGPDGLKIVQRRVAYRLSLTAEAATKYAAALAMEEALASAETVKMWVATSPLPCSHCEKLNGMTAAWGKSFPEKFHGAPRLSVYADRLTGPPRHPQCRCIIVSVRKK